MKTLVQHASLVFDRWGIAGWIRRILFTGSTQLLIQGLGFVGGILIIRMLTPQQYALYVLANTILGTMTILADGGISAGVMTEGGKVWRDRTQLGRVLATGLQLRARFALGSGLLALPFLGYLLRENGASWTEVALLIGAILPAFALGLTNSLLQIASRLWQDIVPLQKNQVGVSVGRLSLLLALFAFPYAFVAILAAGLPQLWSNRNLRRISVGYADWQQPADPEARRAILTMVRRILPLSLYNCVAGQVTIFMLAIFGTTTAVAEIGALGRIDVLFSVISMLFMTLVTPRFARMQLDSGRQLVRRYALVAGGLVALGSLILLSTHLLADAILWVLGSHYAHLQNELVLQATNGSILLLVGVTTAIFTSRGIVITPLVLIPINIFTIATGIYFFDLTSLQGVLYFNIYKTTADLVMYLGYYATQLYTGQRA